MSLETDLLLDRRRLKRRLVFWRTFAVLAVLAAVLVALHGGGIGIGRAHVARLQVSGLITEDRKLTRAVDKLADDDQRQGADRQHRQPRRQRRRRREPARRDRPGRREEAGGRGDGRPGRLRRLHDRGAGRPHLRPARRR